MCVCVCVCVCACVCMCACVCERLRERVCVVFAETIKAAAYLSVGANSNKHDKYYNKYFVFYSL